MSEEPVDDPNYIPANPRPEQMPLTLDWLIAHNACALALQQFKDAFGESADYQAVLDRLAQEHKDDWARLWQTTTRPCPLLCSRDSVIVDFLHQCPMRYRPTLELLASDGLLIRRRESPGARASEDAKFHREQF